MFPQVTFVDAHTLFADETGEYQSSLPDDDRQRPCTMRAGDGIHLTGDGGDHLAADDLRRSSTRAGRSSRRRCRASRRRSSSPRARPRSRGSGSSSYSGNGSSSSSRLQLEQRIGQRLQRIVERQRHDADHDRDDHAGGDRPPTAPAVRRPRPTTPTDAATHRPDLQPVAFGALVGRLPPHERRAGTMSEETLAQQRRRSRRPPALVDAAAQQPGRAGHGRRPDLGRRARRAPGRRVRPRARGERGRRLPGHARATRSTATSRRRSRTRTSPTRSPTSARASSAAKTRGASS